MVAALLFNHLSVPTVWFRQPIAIARSRMSVIEVSPNDDNTLLQRVAGGDHAAFAQFYDRVSGPLYSLAMKMLGDAHDAQDALQEGMEHLWRKAPTFDPARASAFSWSVMIFRSRLIDRIRRRASQARMIEKVTEHADAEPHDAVDGLMNAVRKEDCSIIRRVLATLKEEQRELLGHAFYSGLTQQEIAEQTGKPLGTVKTVIRRALLELRAKLQREGYP